MPPLGFTLPVHVRVPEPNPDNVRLWRRVLASYHSFTPGYNAFLCDHLSTCNRDGVISWPERCVLMDEVRLFMSPPLSGRMAAFTLVEAARWAGAFPSDLDPVQSVDCVEFRLRWLRWRAGLTHRALPWADAHREA